MAWRAPSATAAPVICHAATIDPTTWPGLLRSSPTDWSTRSPVGCASSSAGAMGRSAHSAAPAPRPTSDQSRRT
eukprot:642583-Alexandrium_andersonii.AAC.1